MSKLLLGVLVALVAMIAPAVAFADSSETAVSMAASMAIEIVTPALLLVLTWGAARVSSALQRWLGISVSDTLEKQVEEWIREGASFAAKEAKRIAREEGRKVELPETLDHGAQYVLEELKDRGIEGWSKEKLKKRIRSVLEDDDEGDE